MTQLDGSTRSSVASSHGLTALHLAVLASDYGKVRDIVKDREQGIDARTATGTTAYMIAALYGRTEIFLFLNLKKASPFKKDIQGNSAIDYVKQESPFVKELIDEYNSIPARKPDAAGRRLIYGVLKSRQSDSKLAYARGRADARAEAQPQAQPQPSVNMEQAKPQQTLQDPHVRFAFIRSLDGKQQEFVEVKRIAMAEHGNMRRHCTGFVHAADENSTHIFAISGWGSSADKNVVFKNVLDQKEYTQLVRRVAALLEFELEGYHFDSNYPGTAAEQKGIFVACHSEKQLAVSVLIRAICHVFGTKAITVTNLSQLKDQLHKLPPGLRETVIHLDHKHVCRSCIQFLEVLTEKTGLIVRCQAQDWYTYGERCQLRPYRDANYTAVSCTPVSGKRAHSSPNDDTDVIDDEIGVFNSDGTTAANLQGDPVDDDGDSSMGHGGPVAPSTPSNRGPGHRRQLVLRVPTDCEKRGSPVYEEPQHHIPRYPKLDVTPPSQKTQALPTPQSHTRLAEIPRVTISPSPAGASSAFGPQTDSMSPSMSQEFEVEEILQSKEENGVNLYLVKWKGYPHDSNTWEPESNLVNASDAISKFWEELRAVQSHSHIQDLDA